MLQARIDSLKGKSARAFIVDRSSLPDDTVVFGARVRIKNLASATRKSTNSSAPATRTTTTTRSSPPARAAKGCSARK